MLRNVELLGILGIALGEFLDSVCKASWGIFRILRMLHTRARGSLDLLRRFPLVQSLAHRLRSCVAAVSGLLLATRDTMRQGANRRAFERI